jgi:hypothetical protein
MNCATPFNRVEMGLFRPKIAIWRDAKLIFATGTDFALGSSVAVNEDGCGRPGTEVLNKLARLVPTGSTARRRSAGGRLSGG